MSYRYVDDVSAETPVDPPPTADRSLAPTLDLAFVRNQFPAFDEPDNVDQSFFENAGGSFACRQTIEALAHFYTATKVQPYAEYTTSAGTGAAMDRSRQRWAEALGVEPREVVFGPSTSMNTYVLAQAFGAVLRPDDVVIVTNQDHEANTGAIRRAAERVGCTIREWRTDPATGLLDVDDFATLLDDRTALVTVPHASNIVGQENDIARITTLAHRAGAHVIVDGVSFAPHCLPDVAALDADVYLFSLYKTYSVHQGLMVVRNGLLDELPNQSHFFNDEVADKRLNPAGPDHAQVAAAGAVLDYIVAVHEHHGGSTGDDLPRRHRPCLRALARARGLAHAAIARGALGPRRRSRPRALDDRDGCAPPVSDGCVRAAPTGTLRCRPRTRAARRPDEFGSLLRCRGCSTVSVSTPTVGWSGSRSCTTRRPPTSRVRLLRWTRSWLDFGRLHHRADRRRGVTSRARSA